MNALTAAGIAIAAPGAIAAVHLTTLCAASLLSPRQARCTDIAPRRLLVLVPARNEERLIGRAVAALVRQRRPGDIVMVIADRCTDRTAAVAASAGAEIVERPDGAEPGKAAAIHDGLRAAAARPWDALVTVDADSVVDDGFFDACERVLQEGAAVAQGRSEALPGDGVLTNAAVVAASLQGVALARGRDRLGVSVRLKGPGMIVRRDVVEAHPFPLTGSSEDTRYGIDLVLAGHVARHCDGARVRSQGSRRLGPTSRQRVRWEAGRLRLARRYVGPLLRTRGASAVEAAVHLATPPLAVAMLLVSAGTALAAAGGSTPVVIAMGGLLGLIGADVVIALTEAGAGAKAWTTLALAPAYVPWKAMLQVRAILDRGNHPFEPTVRD